jgi:hypothetical protein
LAFATGEVRRLPDRARLTDRADDFGLALALGFAMDASLMLSALNAA